MYSTACRSAGCPSGQHPVDSTSQHITAYRSTGQHVKAQQQIHLTLGHAKSYPSGASAGDSTAQHVTARCITHHGMKEGFHQFVLSCQGGAGSTAVVRDSHQHACHSGQAMSASHTISCCPGGHLPTADMTDRIGALSHRATSPSRATLTCPTNRLESPRS